LSIASKQQDFRIQKVVRDASQSRWDKYAQLVVGSDRFVDLVKYEIAALCASWVPGGLGLVLRERFYRLIVGKMGKNVVFGRNVTFRHPGKIRIGDNVVIDDNCMIDAKGSGNRGITIGNGVFIGRDSTLYCKNGDIELRDNVNIGVNCTLASAHKVTVGQNTRITGYAYLISGGDWDYENPAVKMIDQSSPVSKGPLIIGADCWLGARATVLDAVRIGDASVIGAGSVVSANIPDHCLALGIPARVVKRLKSVAQRRNADEQIHRDI
jgi:acetyltransferase-like isoleucine patch superfamily enzyme